MLLALLTLLACDDNAILPYTPTQDGVACEWTRTPVGDDEDPGVGFTPGEVYAAVEGEHRAVLRFEDGGSTGLSITLARGGAGAEWASAVATDPDTGEALSAEDTQAACPSTLELGLTWTFVTDDGAFDEVFEVTVEPEVASGVDLGTLVQLDAIEGSFVPEGMDPAEWDTVELQLFGSVGSAGTTGEVALHAERRVITDTSDADESEEWTVGTWATED